MGYLKVREGVGKGDWEAINIKMRLGKSEVRKPIEVQLVESVVTGLSSADSVTLRS